MEMFNFIHNTAIVQKEKDQRCLFLNDSDFFLVKRTVYVDSLVNADTPTDFFVFVILQGARATQPSSGLSRDHRKFKFAQDDRFLYFGSTDDRKKRAIFHKVYSPSCSHGCKCTMRRTDIPPTHFELVSNVVQGPFTVRRVGVCRKDRANSSNKHTKLVPNLAVFEIEIDGHSIWIDQQLILTLLHGSTIETILKSAKNLPTTFKLPLDVAYFFRNSEHYMSIVTDCIKKSLMRRFFLPDLSHFSHLDFSYTKSKRDASQSQTESDFDLTEDLSKRSRMANYVENSNSRMSYQDESDFEVPFQVNQNSGQMIDSKTLGEFFSFVAKTSNPNSYLGNYYANQPSQFPYDFSSTEHLQQNLHNPAAQTPFSYHSGNAADSEFSPFLTDVETPEVFDRNTKHRTTKEKKHYLHEEDEQPSHMRGFQSNYVPYPKCTNTLNQEENYINQYTLPQNPYNSYQPQNIAQPLYSGVDYHNYSDSYQQYQNNYPQTSYQQPNQMRFNQATKPLQCTNQLSSSFNKPQNHLRPMNQPQPQVDDDYSEIDENGFSYSPNGGQQMYQTCTHQPDYQSSKCCYNYAYHPTNSSQPPQQQYSQSQQFVRPTYSQERGYLPQNVDEFDDEF